MMNLKESSFRLLLVQSALPLARSVAEEHTLGA